MEFPMQPHRRIWSCAYVLLAAVVLSACTGQKEPAQKLIGSIEATVTAASTEAAKYVPDQLADVQAQLGALKGSYDKQDYAAVMAGAPAVLDSAQGLATAAAAKKDAILKALNDEWTGLAASVPNDVAAIQNHLDLLAKKPGKKLAAGIDLDAAKAGMADATALWSKAQGAFASGNLDEAVRTAKDVQAKVTALAASLKLDLPAAASS
jgi:hypothetical protein